MVSRRCHGERATVLAFALMLSFSLVSQAETKLDSTADYDVVTWGVSEGLPDPTVLSLAQTPDGYIWCGTKDGLAQFDGVRFIVFNGQNTPELGNGQINSLFVDRHGTLWIGTRDGRLVRFHNNTFVSYFLPNRSTIELPILSMANDDQGGLWVMPEDQSNIMRFYDGRFYPAVGLWPGGPRKFNMRSDFDNSIWLTTYHTIAHRQHSQVTVLFKTRQNHPYNPLFHAPSRTGGFWTSGAGHIGIWKNNGWLWRSRELPQNIIVFLSSHLQYGVEDNLGRLWLASASKGVCCFETNGNVLHFTTQQGLGSDHTFYILVDPDDDIWVATENGLSRIRPALFHVLDHRQGLTAHRVTGVFPTPKGGIWIGTDGGGLNELLGGKVVQATNGLPSERITAVLVDSASNTWVGTADSGLFHSTPEGFARVNTASLSPEISTLFEDSSNRLWVGQRSLNTIACLVPGGGWRSFTLPNSTPIIDVRCFAEDGDKCLWIGTWGNGLFRWDGVRFVHFTRTNGLPSNLITLLHFDRKDQSLWIGTGGGGLVRWKDGRFAVCNTGDGLWDNTIFQMLEDGQGWFWFGSPHGIFRVRKTVLQQFMEGDLKHIHSTAYSKADGLPTLLCSSGFQPAGCRSMDGRLWFPTVRGLVWVNPAEIPINPRPPVVQIEQVLLNGKEIHDVTVHNTNDPSAPVFQIPPGTQRCVFRYTGLSFDDPTVIQFKYRMEGLDQNWIETGTMRSATYSHLPPGNYRFVVTAANRDGVWNNVGAGLRFRVLPEFWQTTWFLLVSFGAISVLLVGTGWMVARSRAQKRLALIARENALERERTRIARDLHDEMGAKLTKVSFLNELAKRNLLRPVEAEREINHVSDTARELIKALDEIVWAVNPKNDSLENLANYICRYAGDYLQNTNLQCRFDIPSKVPDYRLSADSRHNLFLALKEALQNVLKHSNATELCVGINVQHSQLKVSVSDNGCGFNPSAIPTTAARRVMRNGMTNMRQRLKDIGGHCEITSALDHGTTVTFSVPLPEGFILR